MIKTNSLLIVITSLLLSVTIFGCSSDRHDRFANKDNSLLPMPKAKPQSPSDDILKSAMLEFFQKNNMPANSRYSFIRADINGDGLLDALVYMKTPYGYWCSLDGCTMHVMAANTKNFRHVSTVESIRKYIEISEQKNNGWNDIIVKIDGKWSQSKKIRLKFNGRTYPNNPESGGYYAEQLIGKNTATNTNSNTYIFN